MAEPLRTFYFRDFDWRRVSGGPRIASNRAARRCKRARIQSVKGPLLDTIKARPIK
jgi:hypothetical protein